MSNRMPLLFFGVVFMSAIAIASVFGGFALLLFLLGIGATAIAERAFAVRGRKVNLG